MKKLLSLLLVFVMLFSLLPFSALAAEDTPSAAEETTACQVTGISVEGKTATVTYRTDRTSELVVAIYEEGTNRMLGSGHKIVTASASTATVTIEIDSMPAYYTASAYLLEAETLVPLCDPCTASLYILEKLRVWNSGNCGESAVWTLYENGLLVISGTGAMADYSFASTPWWNYLSQIKSVVIEDGVTSIGDYAFYDCYALESVTIPDSVTSIGDYAFSSCDALETVTIGAGVTSIGDYAFYDCYALESVTIGDGVTSIGDYAFYICRALKTVTIPDSVTSIGQRAFYGCYALETVTIPDSVTSIGSYAFEDCTALKTVTYGGKKIHWNLAGSSSAVSSGVEVKFLTPAANEVLYSGTCGASLTWALLDTGELRISGMGAMTDYSYGDAPWYSYRAGIETVTIPDSVTSIGDYAFSNCKALETVTIPDSVTSIGDHAFYYCTALETVTIPDSVTSISWGAFYDCTALTDVYYSGTKAQWKMTGGIYPALASTTIHYEETTGKTLYSGTCGENLTWALLDTGELRISGTGAMTDYSYGDAPWYSYRAGIETVTIPDSVTSIGGRAFYDCTALETVTIPDSVTSIGGRAFYGCYAFTTYEVSADNTVYSAVDGVLFNKDKTALISYPQGKKETSYTIPDSVTSIGDYAFSNCKALETVTIPDSVTSIGDHAFYYCTALASITIPDSVTSIGQYAFEDCRALETVTIPDSVTSIGDHAFYYCTALETVTIPDSVTSIGQYAFYGCRALESVTIPESVTSIGNYAFEYCTALTDVYYSGTKAQWKMTGGIYPALASTTIHYEETTGKTLYSGTCGENLTWALLDTGELRISGTGAMTGYSYGDAPWYSYGAGIESVVIEDGVSSIGDYAFEDCRALESVTIPDGVSSIGDYAFYGCRALESVTILDGVTSIGDHAFYYCTALASITIPDSVTSIGDRAFYYCTALETVTLGKSVTSIGDGAFYYCTALETVTLGKSVTSIGWGAFKDCTAFTTYEVSADNTVYSVVDGVLFNKDKTALISYPQGKKETSYTIPDSVTSIRAYAFEDCRALESVVIEDGVTSIGSYAFEDCRALESVVIEDGVTSIGSYAFYDCYALETVTIGNGVTSIGYNAFYECTALKDVFFCGPELQWKVATGSSNVVPSETTIHYGEATGKTLRSGTCGESLTWELLDTGELRISGTGAMTDYTYSSNVPWYNYRAGIETVTIPDSVTSIGDRAFYYCTALETVTIPDSVTSIGQYAFLNCTALETVTIPDGVTSIRYGVFDGCTALESVTIGEGVTSIGSSAFSDCTALKTVTIPGSVESIGYGAFEDCTALKDVYYGSTKAWWSFVDIYDNNAPLTSATFHYGSVKDQLLHSGSCGSMLTWELYDTGKLVIRGTGEITSFSWGDYKSAVTSVVIEDGVTSIGSDAFYNCTALESVTIPDSVTSIGSYAFYNCTALKNVYYGGAKRAWQWISISSGNTWLTRATIHYGEASGKKLYSGTCGESLTWKLYDTGELRICGTGAMTEHEDASNAPWYNYRTGIESIVVEDDVTSIGSYAFSDCTALASVAIPDSVTSIGDRAFYYCTALETVTIPDSVTSIGSYAFSDCTALASVAIPDSVTSIGTGAFSGCKALKTVTIPTGVTSIGSNAFSDCTALASVAIPDSVTSIGTGAFSNCTALKTVTCGGKRIQWNLAGGRAAVPNGVEVEFLTQPANEILDSGTCGESLTWALYDTGELRIGGTGAMPDYTSFSDAPWYGYCLGIESVVIEDGVTSIGSNALSDCSVLTSATLPVSVTSIGDGAFNNCTALESASYLGSKVRWAFVKVDQNNTALTRVLNYAEASNTVLRSGICGSKLTWEFYDTGELVISGTGQMIDYTSASPAPWNEFKGEVRSVTIADGVTTIGARAFYNCTSLKRVTVGDDVTSVGEYAFVYCALEGITIPDSVTSIGNYAFNCCTALKSVTIPDSVTTIGAGAFQSCRSLTSFAIPNGVTSIESDTFYGCESLTSITIGSGVTSIKNSAFLSCSALADVYITDLAAWCKISFGSYYGHPMDWANNLYIDGELATEIVIPDSVTKIAYRAFYNCTAIESVTIPNGVTSIGYQAFYSCTALENIAIPYTVRNIEGSAFDGCNSLSTVYYNSTETWWSGMQVGNYNANLTCATICFSGSEDDVLYSGTCGSELKWEILASRKLVISGTGAMTNYSSSNRAPWKSYSDCIDSVLIEDGVTSIGSDAFYYCTALKTVSIPDSVTSIGSSAFYNCTALVSITIPVGVTGIGSYAFYYCTALKTVSIPDSVTSIWDSAFYNCTALESVTIPESVTSIGYNAFYNCTALVSASYPGSAVQWKLVNVGDNNNALIDVLQCAEATNKIIRSGTCGDSLTWELYDTGELHISGTGAMTEYGSYPSSARAPWYSYRNAILSVVIENGVASIGDCAFWCCTMVENVVISDSVKSIGGFSFYGCAALKNITFPAGMTSIVYDMFRECTSLTSIVIPDGVTDIGSYAFYDCTALESITLPDSVTNIWDSAFYNCKALKDVYYTGTEAQWSAITISSGNDKLTSATIHCTGEETVIEPMALDGAAEETTEEAIEEVTTEEVSEEITEEVPEEATEEVTEETTEETTEEATEETTEETTEEATTEEATTEEATTEEATTEEATTEEATTEEVTEETTTEETTEEGTIELVAAYTGVLSEANGQKVASFSDLMPNERYVLLVMKDANAPDPLAPSNLLYIMQGVSSAEGTLSLVYAPRMTAANAAAVVYGPEKTALSEAAIKIGKTPSGFAVSVECEGSKLTEGVDYTVTTSQSDGVTTVTITGFGEYGGTMTVTLDHEPGDMNSDGVTTILDVLALLKAVAGITDEPAHADVNGDGDVTILDVLTLLKYVAGIADSVVY